MGALGCRCVLGGGSRAVALAVGQQRAQGLKRHSVAQRKTVQRGNVLCVGLLAESAVQCRDATLRGAAMEETAQGATGQVSVRCS